MKKGKKKKNKTKTHSTVSVWTDQERLCSWANSRTSGLWDLWEKWALGGQAETKNPNALPASQPPPGQEAGTIIGKLPGPWDGDSENVEPRGPEQCGLSPFHLPGIQEMLRRQIKANSSLSTRCGGAFWKRPEQSTLEKTRPSGKLQGYYHSLSDRGDGKTSAYSLWLSCLRSNGREGGEGWEWGWGNRERGRERNGWKQEIKREN